MERFTHFTLQGNWRWMQKWLPIVEICLRIYFWGGLIVNLLDWRPLPIDSESNSSVDIDFCYWFLSKCDLLLIFPTAFFTILVLPILGNLFIVTLKTSLFRTDVTQDVDDKDGLKMNLILSILVEEIVLVLNKLNKWICSAKDIYRKAA